MADWQIVPYEADHARKIAEDNLRQQEDYLADVNRYLKYFEMAASGGPAYTLTVADVPVACAGVVLQDGNKGEAWSLLSTLFYKHKVKVYRALKSGLDAAIVEHGLRRVQSVINPKYQQSIDFIECLGFEYEGRLRKWGPNSEDFLMYARCQ